MTMSHAQLAPGLTLTRVGALGISEEITCACARVFTAKTDARVGVTRSNANRHAVACEDALMAYTRTAEQEAAYDELARPLTFLTDAGKSAVDACRTAAEKGTALEITPAGKVAKMVRTSLDVRYSTDGSHIVAKNGRDATDENPWALYRTVNLGVADGEHLLLVGTYPTCTAAFAVSNVVTPA